MQGRCQEMGAGGERMDSAQNKTALSSRKRQADALPLTTARKARVTSGRACPQAEQRIPGTWVLRSQAAGRKCPMCLQCKEPVDVGDVKACRQSDVTTGGRWLHLTCVPGGFWQDDVLQTDENEPAALVTHTQFSGMAIRLIVLLAAVQTLRFAMWRVIGLRNKCSKMIIWIRGKLPRIQCLKHSGCLP